MSHNADVSANKLPRSSSPKIKSRNKWCSKAGCWRGDEGKAQSPLPHSLLALADAPKAPTQRDAVEEVPFPFPDLPFRKAQGEAHNFRALEWLPVSRCCMWGAFRAREGCMPGQGVSHASPEEFITGNLHPAGMTGATAMGETPSPQACVCDLPPLSVSLRSCSLDRTGERVNPSASTRV